MEIVKNVYTLTVKLPDKETYGLISQMKRSAVSLPSNVAEGFNRYHNKEYRQFLYVALGSAAELETQLIIANELGYIDDNNLKEVAEKIDHLSRMIVSLIKKLN